MTDEQQQQYRAAQLRKPQGEAGIQTGEWMSKANWHIIQDTLSILKAEPKDNILEIGMGNGFFVNKILSLHPTITYTGCDYSELMINESERLNADWILKGQSKFVLSSAASLPFTDNTFNKLFSINTIYFWDNESEVLTELNRVLQPGGKLIVAFRPKHQTEKYPFTKYGFNLFSKEEVVTLLLDNGFSISETMENNEPDFDMNGEIMKMENVIVVANKK